MSIYDYFLILAIFCFIIDVAIHVYFDLLYRKDKKEQQKDQDKHLEELGKVNNVELMVINSKGYLGICVDPVHAPQFVFCERMRSFCNTQCQFFDSAIRTNEPYKPYFDCWMLPGQYQAKELHDWRDTKPGCAPEKKP